MHLRANEVYTLTTVDDGKKGIYDGPPNSSPFPVPYVETFESISVLFILSFFESIRSETANTVYME